MTKILWQVLCRRDKLSDGDWRRASRPENWQGDQTRLIRGVNGRCGKNSIDVACVKNCFAENDQPEPQGSCIQKKQCLDHAPKGASGQVLFFCAPWSGFCKRPCVRRPFFEPTTLPQIISDKQLDARKLDFLRKSCHCFRLAVAWMGKKQ